MGHAVFEAMRGLPKVAGPAKTNLRSRYRTPPKRPHIGRPSRPLRLTEISRRGGGMEFWKTNNAFKINRLERNTHLQSALRHIATPPQVSAVPPIV